MLLCPHAHPHAHMPTGGRNGAVTHGCTAHSTHHVYVHVQSEAMLRAMEAGLGSAEEAVAASCLCGLCKLVGSPGVGGSEVLALRLLDAGLVPQLDGLWARLLAGRAEGAPGEGPSWRALGPPAMALCAELVRLPGLAAALVAFGAPATLAAAAKGFEDACFADACEAGEAAAASPALAVLRACARELGGRATPKTPARVGFLAQVASGLLAGLGWPSAGTPTSAAGRVEGVGALADVLTCAPAELVGAIAWADAAPRR